MSSYVYHHVDPRSGETKYIGTGSKGRAWACGWSSVGGPRRGNRTKEHQEWLNQLFTLGYTMGDIVVIVVKGLTKEEAHSLERQDIIKFSVGSLFNKELGAALLSLNERQIKKAKRLRMIGTSYKSIGEEIGSSTMTAYRLLNGRTKNYA